jgi:hypothetical protein
MRKQRRPVGKHPRVGTALIGLLALTGCTQQTHDSGRPAIDLLGSMMASESEINTIMGVSTIHPKTALQAPMKNDNFEPLSRQECIVSIGNAMDWAYRDSGYRQFRETQLADDDDNVEVDQAITAFDSPKAARALVARSVDIWRQCGGGTLTLSYNGGATYSSRLLAVPSVVDGINVTQDQPAAGAGTITHRAILAVDSMVVDLRISDYDIDNTKTVELAKAIADRNAL